MSIEIVLVPLAISAVAAVHARLNRPGPAVCDVSTRMKDQVLLERALVRTGALVEISEGGFRVKWDEIVARFTEVDDLWTASFTGEVDEQAALERVRLVDQAYGLEVQAAVVERITEQADTAGMRLTSKVRQPDESVTLRLIVGEDRR